jgi:hypothetical protein
MTSLIRSLVAILTASVIASCSTTGGTVPQSQKTARVAHSTSNGKLLVRVRIPKKRPAWLRQRYISAATKGMSLAFAGKSSFTRVIGLTPNDPRCSGSPLICSIYVMFSAGSYDVTINAYDQAPANGAIPASAKLLSGARVKVSVKPGIVNDLRITLDGVPAGIFVGNFPIASAGTAFLNKSFTVTVKDADGYVILGTYSTPITLSDSDTSGATAIATAGSDGPPSGKLFSSGDVSTISYVGIAIKPVTIGATAGAAVGRGVFAVRVPVFVADYANAAVNEIPPGCLAASCVNPVGGGFSFPVGVAVDGLGNVFVAELGGMVKEVPPGCVAADCVATLGGGFSHVFGVAVDGAGNVFASDSGSTAVKKIPPGCFTAGCVTTIGGGFLTPGGVAVDGAGNVYVTSNDAVNEIPPGCLSAGCVTTLGGGFSSPVGVAIDDSGNVFVGDLGEVKEMPPGCKDGSCVTTLGGGFIDAAGVAVDGFGDVFVADYSFLGVVKEIPPGCVTADCVIEIGGGFHDLRGVGVL